MRTPLLLLVAAAAASWLRPAAAVQEELPQVGKVVYEFAKDYVNLAVPSNVAAISTRNTKAILLCRPLPTDLFPELKAGSGGSWLGGSQGWIENPTATAPDSSCSA